MKNINKKENKHDFLSLELLVPNLDKVDCNRGYMFSSHFSQCSNLKNPELPFIYTNFENQFGDYSDLGFEDTNEKIKVLGKVVKNENVYFLIVHKLESDTYDIIERRNEFWLTEKFGFTYNNEKIDSIKIGDTIDKGERLFKSYNYDECDNFRYGANIKVAFFTEKLKTLEDAIVISKEAAEKFTSYNVEKVTIILNNNDLLLNLNENPNDEYKCFPDINEDIENFLCVRRRINFKKIYSFDDLSLNSLKPSDEKFYTHGKITDIDIYSNMDEKDLEDGVYNKQIKRILKKRKIFNKEFIKLTENLVEKESKKCSNQLIQMYNRIKMELDKIKFSYEASVFSGLVIQFTILKENKLSIGSKLSGRYGNKGVVSAIYDSNETYGVKIIDSKDMPIIKSGPMKGMRPDALLNPLGVPNRLNIAQQYEQELNFISLYIRNKIKLSKSLEEKEKWYFDFIKNVNVDQYNTTKKIYDNFTLEEKNQYMKECEEIIYIHQEPFFNYTDLDLLCDLYEKYDFVKPFELEGINIPLVIGEMYFMRLKHDLIIYIKGRV